MRIINGRAGVNLETMAEGEVFKLDDDYWLVTDYVDEHDKTLCANLSSGYGLFLNKDSLVIPVSAEVHIL